MKTEISSDFKIGLCYNRGMNSKTAEEKLRNYRAPRWEDFPRVELYMDQVIALLTEWLQPLYFDSQKPAVTPSMINNYVKHSIVRPPVKKHYKAYHLGFLYVVLVLKQCYSLQEISSLIQIYSDIENMERIGHDFNSFAMVLEESLHEIMETGNTNFQPYENPSWQQKLMCSAIRTIANRLYSAAKIQQAREELEKKVSETVNG